MAEKMGLPGEQNIHSERAPIIPVSAVGSGKGNQNMTVEKEKSRGLTLTLAALFLIGEMTGSGIIALPKVIDNTGISGMLILPSITLLLTYTGKALATSWSIIQERYPEHRGHVRDPYPLIGQITYGRPGRTIVSGLIFAANFGIFVVMLITIAENTGEILSTLGLQTFMIQRILTIAAVMTPIMWLGTPKDFWFVGVGAAVTPIAAGSLLLANTIYDRVQQGNVTVEHAEPTWHAFPMAIGTMVYAYACHCIFPTIQTDMLEQNKFVYAVYVSFSVTCMTYYPICIAGYFVFGKRMTDNYLMTISAGPMATIAQSMVTLHFLFASIMVINPVFQHLEKILNIPTEFNWKRCVARTVLMAIVILIAILVPSFGIMVSLVGGSILNVIGTICPALFYLKLCSMEGDWEQIKVGYGTRLCCYFIVLFGLTSCLLCTYSAVYAIFIPIHPMNVSLSN